MEVDLLTFFAVIVGLVVGVLVGMFFTSQKKFWERYEVSPTTYSYTVIMYCSVHVRRDESNSSCRTLIIIHDDKEEGQSYQLVVRTKMMLSLMQIR